MEKNQKAVRVFNGSIRSSLALALYTTLLCCVIGADGHERVMLTLTEESTIRLTVRAHWDRIAEGNSNLHKTYPEVFEYSLSEPVKEYTASDFRAFLPPNLVTVGDVWELNQAKLDPFLKQFHRGAQARLRAGSPGAFACLRALSDRYAEITFRFHGEVELLPEEIYLTLAQFTGHVLIDRKTKVVVSFRLHVPDRNTNADVNAYSEADIVYIPRMELYGGDVARRDAIDWRTAIPEAEAKRRLARCFYRSEEIAWTDLKTAISRAQVEHKPLHVLILFGVLNDESC